ncbi:torsin-1A-interacting protein 2-like [Pecten maximus]|uniref:torsin-1A-interacting protein 2-like n=1 Tax=Pecten maximus TaxID=6579 RepID=UPI0014587537|nr:torsin-1A-interacting protein 2-like [Pecten maximus]XP_033732411.1 torsin-1A-interacting protein 2-like [Pecten maximus]
MAEVSEKGSSPYNLRKNVPRKGPSPRKPIRGNEAIVNGNEVGSSEDEIDSTPTKKGSSSPGVVNVSISSKNGASPSPKSIKTRSPAGSPQSDKGFSSNSSFEKSPSLHKRTDKKAKHQSSKRLNQEEQSNNQEEQSNNQEEQSNSWPFAALTIVVVVLGIVIFRNPHILSNSDHVQPELNPDGNTRISYDHFQERFQELKMKFPGQARDFWRTVFGMLRPMVVENNPAAPAVFMMVVPKNQQGESRTAECLAKQLLSLYSGLFNRSLGSQGSRIHITEDLKHESPAEDKKELDNKLRYIFDQSQEKGVILDNFESLSPFAALLLHGYCDGDNAPYKDVLFIQVVHMDRQAGEITSQKNYMDKYLKELWIRDLDEDKIQPLLTRIANNVAMVTPENEQTLRQHCQ